MPFEPEFEDGEEIVEEIELIISKKISMYLLLTTRAAYWPGKSFSKSPGLRQKCLMVGG